MSPSRHRITRDQVLSIEDYARQRDARRAALIAVKRRRRIAVGPDVTVHFESYDTMWQQVHEMLFIEKGGEPQIQGELDAYNPLIPNGRELVATILFEIDEPERRRAFLSRLGGVEATAFLSVAGEEIVAVPEADLERSTPGGKASSVQFVHFPFTEARIARFRTPDTPVILGFKHPGYAHQAVMPEQVRAALAEDFD